MAKQAAKTLIEQLLSEHETVNRIAVMSYTRDVNLLADFNKNTFTQVAVRQAAVLSKTSGADLESIILISGDVPTLGYQIHNPDDCLIDYGIRDKQTNELIPQEQFDYTRVVGDGSSSHSLYDELITGKRQLQGRYYSHGNSTIAEVGFYKQAGMGELYTVASNTSLAGKRFLRQLATPGRAYAATAADLRLITEEVGGKNNVAMHHIVVDDQMTRGVKAVQIINGDKKEAATMLDGGASIKWNLGPPVRLENDKLIAELTYRIEITDEIVAAIG